MPSPCHVCGIKCRRVNLDVMHYWAYNYRGFPEMVKQYFERHIICRVCRDRLRERIMRRATLNEHSLSWELNECFGDWLP